MTLGKNKLLFFLAKSYISVLIVKYAATDKRQLVQLSSKIVNREKLMAWRKKSPGKSVQSPNNKYHDYQ